MEIAHPAHNAGLEARPECDSDDLVVCSNWRLQILLQVPIQIGETSNNDPSVMSARTENALIEVERLRSRILGSPRLKKNEGRHVGTYCPPGACERHIAHDPARDPSIPSSSIPPATRAVFWSD